MRSLPAERRSGFRRRQRAITVHPRGVSRMQPTTLDKLLHGVEPCAVQFQLAQQEPSQQQSILKGAECAHAAELESSTRLAIAASVDHAGTMMHNMSVPTTSRREREERVVSKLELLELLPYRLRTKPIFVTRAQNLLAGCYVKSCTVTLHWTIKFSGGLSGPLSQYFDPLSQCLKFRPRPLLSRP